MEISWTCSGCQPPFLGTLPVLLRTHLCTRIQKQPADGRKYDADDEEEREDRLRGEDGPVATLSAAVRRPPSADCLSADCTYCHAFNRCCRNAVSMRRQYASVSLASPLFRAQRRVRRMPLTRRSSALRLLVLVAARVLARYRVGVLGVRCRHGEIPRESAACVVKKTGSRLWRWKLRDAAEERWTWAKPFLPNLETARATNYLTHPRAMPCHAMPDSTLVRVSSHQGRFTRLHHSSPRIWRAWFQTFDRLLNYNLELPK
jgi:hypothetical protein